MTHLRIQEAFARHGAKPHDMQWSVSAWATDGVLVVSLWAQHYRKGRPGTVEYADRLDRWNGPGNAEFRRSITQAFAWRSPVRLVVASTHKIDHVQSGRDASKVKKAFDPKIDFIGEVYALSGDDYVFRFQRLPV